MRYPVIVFDWDGTIIDSATTIVECIQQASRDMGLPVPERERASHVIGLGLHDAMRIAVPGLPAALHRLSRAQRTVVVLLHCFDWSQAEVAELLGVARGSVQTHDERALGKLRRALGVTR